MQQWLNLLEETIAHFNEGAVSVWAHTSDKTFIITRAKDSGDFYVTIEAPGFPKTKVDSLESYFKDVFGIEAKY